MPPVLVDTHAHLDDPRFDADRAAVLARARAAGVEQVLCIATTAATSQRCVELAQTHPTLWATVGIQPNHVAEVAVGDWDEVVRLASAPRVVALGETGLDRHWDFTPFPAQEDYFVRHLELGRERGIPVVIHSRKAGPDVVRVLRREWATAAGTGVMHSFTEDEATLAACLELGLYISFAGMLTYKKSEELRLLARSVPLERLLVETDSPYLVPDPSRGRQKRNEPAETIHTAACLAAVQGITLEELAQVTTANARRLFGLPSEFTA
ncbi:MAG TPA: TatD family hydrolase [Gemmatales bacterium]|nr:TatD family hydrolase [Gemmatales bacterium]HMP59292.1 TatD family hydrolase [Gemmatales bacterium]